MIFRVLGSGQYIAVPVSKSRKIVEGIAGMLR